MSRSASDSRSLVWLSAATAFAIIGCTWAFSVARYGGPDEPAHVIRAAAAAHGDLLGTPVDGLEPGYRQVSAPASLASGDPACFRHDDTISAACGVPSADTADVEVATSAGAAPAWYYAVVGVIARVVSSGDDALEYRMAALLLCAMILGYAFARSAPFAGSGWLIAALTPSAWFLVGVVGTSAIEIALVALAVVEAVRRFHDHADTESLARVTAPLALCLILRPAAVIDVVVVALVLIPTVRRPVVRRDVAMLALPLMAAGVATLAWNRWTDLVVSDSRTADNDSLVEAIRRSLGGIPTTAHQAVGALGWNEFSGPTLAQLVWWATLAYAALWVAVRGSQRWWHLRWAVTGLLVPTVIEVIVHHRIGGIWQGRYSIPFAMAGVLYAGSVAAPSRAVLRSVVVAASCAEVLTLWHTLRRYMVGLDGSLTLQRAEWDSLLSPWLLLIVNATAMAWLATIALISETERLPDRPSRSTGDRGIITR